MFNSLRLVRLSSAMASTSRRLMATNLEPLYSECGCHRADLNIRNQPSQNKIVIRHYNSSSSKPPGLSGAKVFSSNRGHDDDGGDSSPQLSIVDILEQEIQDETAELSQHLSTDQFPGFSVETDDSDVKLTKQVGEATVTVRFTVSSSLNEWPEAPQEENQQAQQQQDTQTPSTKLVSMPEFQVSISKKNQTLEMNCYFEEMEQDEETGEPIPDNPVFGIEELVMYEGQPRETEFAVSVEYFVDDLQAALLQYLADHGINDEFAVNLVDFATSYEKKQYIGLMKRLKNFVSK